MEAAFWIMLGLIIYAYLGYPLAIVILSLFIKNTVRKRDIEPDVTFLIAAYNEERSIREKLLNTLALDYPKGKLQVLVVSDASDDGTDDIVREFAPQGVRLLALPFRVGKTEAQNQALARSTGEIVVFSDATTKYETNALRNIVRNYADGTVGAVGGRFKYLDPDKTSVGRGTTAFWDYESFIRMRQTRIRTITGASGCIYSVRRDLYEPLPGDIISDLVEPLKVLEKGYKIVFEPEALAYEETYKRGNDEFRMRVRVISRGMRGLVYMRGLLNPFRFPFISFQLVSHKILRWLVPFFSVALYFVNATLVSNGSFYRLFFGAQTAFYLLAMAGLLLEWSDRKAKVLSLPLYFCIINTASAVALVRTFMRKKDIVWQTVRQ